MNERFFEIFTQEASELNEREWIILQNLWNNF